MTTKEITAHDLRKNLKSVLAETMSGKAEYTISYLGLPKKFKIVIADPDNEKPLLGDNHPLAKFEGIWKDKEEYKIPKREKHYITERDKKLLELYAD